MRLLALLFALAAPTAFAGSYGAIAYSPSTGKSGTSWNYSCVDEATRAAVGFCGQGDCDWVRWVGDQCAALAVASNGATGDAANSNRGLAEYTALQTCANYGGTDCHIQASVCSG
jgi:hypothetical protein